MKRKLEHLATVAVATVCLSSAFGCKSDRTTRSSAVFSQLPPEPPKVPVDEVSPSKWSAGIRALKPIKVYVDVTNLIIVQRVADGIESGKYVIPSLSSHGPSGKFIKFTRVGLLDGLVEGDPLAEVYDYERSQP